MAFISNNPELAQMMTEVTNPDPLFSLVFGGSEGGFRADRAGIAPRWFRGALRACGNRKGIPFPTPGQTGHHPRGLRVARIWRLGRTETVARDRAGHTTHRSYRAVSEELVVECMKRGAADYMLK